MKGMSAVLLYLILHYCSASRSDIGTENRRHAIVRWYRGAYRPKRRGL